MSEYKHRFLIFGQGINSFEQITGIFPLLQQYAGMLKSNHPRYFFPRISVKKLAENTRSFLPVLRPQVIQAFINGNAVYPGRHGRPLIKGQYRPENGNKYFLCNIFGSSVILHQADGGIKYL